MRVLVTGWSSFQDGEATGGDVLSMETVRDSLVEAGIAVDVAWSPDCERTACAWRGPTRTRIPTCCLSAAPLMACRSGSYMSASRTAAGSL